MTATITLRFHDGKFWIGLTNESTGTTNRIERDFVEPDDVARALQVLGLTLAQTRQIMLENDVNGGTSAIKGITLPHNYAPIH